MTRSEALACVLGGVQQDLGDYRDLRWLLEEQFAAALRHDAPALVDVARRVLESLAALERRRQERLVLVSRLVGPGRDMAALLPHYPERARRGVEAAWASLESLVRECKALNARNGRLIVDQHDIMQRVLHGEADIYAPA